MRVTYELQLADWRASDRFFASLQKTKRPASRGYWFARVMVALFLLPTLIAPLAYLDSPDFQTAWTSSGIAALWPLGIALIPLTALAIAWFGAPLLQNRAFRESAFYGRQITLSLEQDCIGGDVVIPWIHVTSVEESPSHVFLVLSDNTVFVIPKRAFETDFAATQFVAYCRDRNCAIDNREVAGRKHKK